MSHVAGFAGAHLVQGGIHLGYDVEAVEDVQGLRAFLADDVQVGLPHVRADELDLRGQFSPMTVKKPWKPTQSRRVMPWSI